MKITSIGILRWNGDTPHPIIMDNVHDLSEFGFFQRGGVKEMLVFVSRTLAERVEPGLRIVDHEGHHCFCVKQADGLTAIAVCDTEYPSRVAFTMLRETLEGFVKEKGDTWKRAEEDNIMRYPPLEGTLKQYQTPEEVDKIMRLETSLAETKDVLHQTIEAVLERGVKLDDLVAKSDDLSSQSKMFYKQAKKTNSCCVIC
eukprot:TRINITY_DN19536_c1_g1_i1.p1 TRINITY_DN19536_c1_g1~~TRINITY_DN19536_c1_g1_i1.p1  ORF type:complete len:200 (+),score=33.30 TRINITY_DN19536_c1_g1_i1:108-707(+)